MKKKLILSIIIVTGALIAGTVVRILYWPLVSKPLPRISPTPSPVTSRSASSSSQVKGSGAVWGKVTDTKGAALAGIVVSVGGFGVTSQPDGSYLVTLDKPGTYVLRFDNPDTKERYQLVDSGEQVIYFSAGENINRDFVVQKLN
jgi:hypothetical protein